MNWCPRNMIMMMILRFLRKTVLLTVFPLVPYNIKTDDNNNIKTFFLQHVLVMQYYNGIVLWRPKVIHHVNISFSQTILTRHIWLLFIPQFVIYLHIYSHIIEILIATIWVAFDIILYDNVLYFLFKYRKKLMYHVRKTCL